MQAQSVPVYVQPQTRSSFMNGTRIGGLNFPGALILIILVGSSIALIIGFFMTVFGHDYQYSSDYYYYYYRTSGVRKAGIVFLCFGGIAFILGVIAAFKANSENKVTRGMVIQTVQVAGPSQHARQEYSSGFGHNQNVHLFPQPVQPPQAQVKNEIPPPYQTWATEGVN